MRQEEWYYLDMKNCKQCSAEFDPSRVGEHASAHGFSELRYCRLCSWRRKLSFSNEYNVYKRECDATGKTIVSVYRPEAKFPVYDRNYWLSDEWEVPSISYDKSRSFLEQYLELSARVPRPNANCVNAENSEYAHLVFDSKNCYLSFQVFLCDRVIGCYRVVRLRDSVNSFFCTDGELLCECSNCNKGYNLKFCEDCEDCSDSSFLYDCRGCRNCFMCANLRGKEYYFKNKKLSKEAYEKAISAYDLSTEEGRQLAKSELDSVRGALIVKAHHYVNSENCEGDYLIDCKGSRDIFFSDKCEDCLWILRGTEEKDCCDCVVGGKIELCYNMLQPGYSYKCAFATACNHCNNIYFSESLDNCNDCVGCISLKRGKNCILNKQYSEEEYAELKNYIWRELNEEGSAEEFFDPTTSPFAYDETIGDLYFPKQTQGECGTCNLGVKYSEAEKKIYEKMKVALPGKCFNCRIQGMARPYSAVEMEEIDCSKCGKTVSCGKSSRRFGKVYCEGCYLGEVY